jgi:xanthine dehydrogenase YagS FAD-binding subunit
MHNFEYAAAADLETALALLREPESEALAGGTDLLGELKRRIRSPRRLVNIKTLDKLGEVSLDPEEGKALKIGALVSISEIERHSIVAEQFPSLQQAASSVASPQLRNMGTLGGNLCQHPRCWYFRNPLFPCWLKGGLKCFAVAGENRLHRILGEGVCHSVHPSDLAPVLIALEARVRISGPDGEREIPLEKLYRLPREDQRQTTVLNRGELVTEIRVPLPEKPGRGIFLKSMERRAWAFALAAVALQLRLDGDRVAEGRMVLGGVAPIPWRAKEAEMVLMGQKLSEDLIQRAGEAAVSGVRPMRDNVYKVQLVQALVRKALTALWTPDF